MIFLDDACCTKQSNIRRIIFKLPKLSFEQLQRRQKPQSKQQLSRPEQQLLRQKLSFRPEPNSTSISGSSRSLAEPRRFTVFRHFIAFRRSIADNVFTNWQRQYVDEVLAQWIFVDHFKSNVDGFWSQHRSLSTKSIVVNRFGTNDRRIVGVAVPFKFFRRIPSRTGE